MSIALITGSTGLIGGEAVRFFSDKGFDIVGIDNDMRREFFGVEASTAWNRARLKREIPGYRHIDADIRNEDAMARVFRDYGEDLVVILHTAAQPSHDWAARDPFTDFSVNATGTLLLLEMTRRHCLHVPFIFTSTNKVYGDRPNHLPLKELETRYELESAHPWAEHGIDETMSIDGTLHSLFGASKVSADVLVQEYGRYFGMKTASFRGGCLTGPSHSGTQLHGFLAYLIRCAVLDKPYTVFGYKGKQVRDNIHSHDLVNAFWHFLQRPRSGAVYNIGGGRHSNCSMLEAIALCEGLTRRPFRWKYSDKHRIGDHMWWISDTRRFQADHPDWKLSYTLEGIIEEIYGELVDRLAVERRSVSSCR